MTTQTISPAVTLPQAGPLLTRTGWSGALVALLVVCAVAPALNLLVPEIEDRPDNTTRFLIIGRKPASPGEADKTTLLVSAAKTDAPGGAA